MFRGKAGRRIQSLCPTYQRPRPMPDHAARLLPGPADTCLGCRSKHTASLGTLDPFREPVGSSLCGSRPPWCFTVSASPVGPPSGAPGPLDAGRQASHSAPSPREDPGAASTLHEQQPGRPGHPRRPAGPTRDPSHRGDGLAFELKLKSHSCIFFFLFKAHLTQFLVSARHRHCATVNTTNSCLQGAHARVPGGDRAK